MRASPGEAVGSALFRALFLLASPIAVAQDISERELCYNVRRPAPCWPPLPLLNGEPAVRAAASMVRDGRPILRS